MFLMNNLIEATKVRFLRMEIKQNMSFSTIFALSLLLITLLTITFVSFLKMDDLNSFFQNQFKKC